MPRAVKAGTLMTCGRIFLLCAFVVWEEKKGILCVVEDTKPQLYQLSSWQ